MLGFLFGDIGTRLGGDTTTVLDDFESYTDTADLQSTWDDPGGQFALETTNPIEGSQSVTSGTDTNARMANTNIDTFDGTTYSCRIVTDTTGGDPGFFIHTQDVSSSSAVFADQVWTRIDTANDELDVFVREGGSYNDQASTALTESISTGTQYRLTLLADAGNSEAVATLYNNDSNTEIGSATCTYSTTWSSGWIGVYGDPENSANERIDYLVDEDG